MTSVLQIYICHALLRWALAKLSGWWWMVGRESQYFYTLATVASSCLALAEQKISGEATIKEENITMQGRNCVIPQVLGHFFQLGTLSELHNVTDMTDDRYICVKISKSWGKKFVGIQNRQFFWAHFNNYSGIFLQKSLQDAIFGMFALKFASYAHLLL